MTGSALWSATVMLAMANFLAVLDMAIANVSVPNIAGGLAVPPNEGTWVITSYSVAEAIVVPITGWLAVRFGTVRVFAFSIFAFGVFSAFSGLSSSLGMLVVFRVLQGLAGGPLMPLSQTLIMQIFPEKQRPLGMTIWSVTTLVAPVLGPILGGFLVDNFDWPSIFWVNVPIGLICGPLTWRMLKSQETPVRKLPIDGVGLGLLVVWVAALQVVLDTGWEHNWFASTWITVLSIIAVTGVIGFLIWELTERNPIVSLKVFRHRAFSTAMVSLALAIGAFFAVNVLTPLWLQDQMGYTASCAGYVSAGFGITAMLASPLANHLAGRFDPRKLIFGGVLWLGLVTVFRSLGTAQMTFSQIAWGVALTGIGLPFFFLPLVTSALGSVDAAEIASAAGLLNFIRALAGAIATSIVTTVWENDTIRAHARLVGVLHSVPGMVSALQRHGFSMAQAVDAIDQTLSVQAMMISTNRVFFGCALAFTIAAFAMWVSPKPKAMTTMEGVH